MSSSREESTLEQNVTNGSIITPSMWFAAFLVALPSFSFGFVLSCLNACLVTGNKNDGADCYHGNDSSCPPGTIYDDLNLTTIEAQLATSLTILGAWIGCLVASGPSQKYGKRMVLLCNNAFFIVGAVFSCTGNIATLFIGRFISGIGVGVASATPSVLLAEIATPETRGTISTLHQVMVTSGIFVNYLTGYVFVTYVDHGWQYIQGFGALPGVLMILLSAYVPESPKWLLMQDEHDASVTAAGVEGAGAEGGVFSENGGATSNVLHHQSHTDTKTKNGSESARAVAVGDAAVVDDAVAGRRSMRTASTDHHMYEVVSRMLGRLRPEHHDAHREISDILSAARKEAADQQGAKEVTWKEVFSYKTGMIIGLGLMFYGSATGINTVIFYSTTIFGLAGFSESIIGTASVGSINLIATICASYLIDRMGRKILLLGGTYLMLGALLLLSIVLISPIDAVAQGVVAVLAALLFVVGYAVGLGAVVWAIMSEVMPTRVRVKAVSLFMSINWGTNLVIGLLTLTAIDGMGDVDESADDDEVIANRQKRGVAFLYFVFAFITFTGVIFVHFYVPETKGQSPEQVAAWGSSKSGKLSAAALAGGAGTTLASTTPDPSNRDPESPVGAEAGAGAGGAADVRISTGGSRQSEIVAEGCDVSLRRIKAHTPAEDNGDHGDGGGDNAVANPIVGASSTTPHSSA